MAINFPNSPILNEQYTYDNKTWEWNGTYWEVYSALTSYITSAYTVGNGVSDISGVTGGNIALKSFSGVNITIVDGGDKLTFSGYPQQNVVGFYLPLSGGTVTGGTIFQSGLTANTVSATTYQNLPVSAVTNGTGISASTSNGVVTITNTAPDQTVTISGGTGITTGGTYPNFTITNSSPDQTVTITGGTSIQITGTYPNFGVDFTGGTILKYYVSASTPTGIINDGDRWFNTTDGVELVYVTDGDGSQWVQPNNGGSNTGSTGSNFTGGTVTGATNFTNGLTGNTISATTYYNLPISGVTDGTGISTSITDGNVTITNTAPDLTVTITGGTNIEITGTYPDFGVNYTGTSQNLIASNSCAITPNNRVYVGNSNYGWGYGLWDLEYPSLSEQYSNVSIPINKTILSGESIDVCGKAYVNDSDGQTCILHFYLYTHNCDITTITELSRRSDSFDKDGLFCFSYKVPIESYLSECDNFLVLGFRATTNDATVCKITYTINSKHSI